MEHKEIEKYKLELRELNADPAVEYKKISCPSCIENIPADNININDKIAKCNHCNVIFSFQKEVLDFTTKEKIKQELIRPEGIDVFYFKNDLNISIEQPVSAVEGLLGSLIPIFAVFFTFIYFVKSDVPLLLPVITWGLGIYPLINLIHRSHHKIHICIDSRNLSITRRPKKFMKDQSYTSSDINQIYIKEIDGRYSVYMIVDGINGQKHIKLISGIDSISKARYLEQEIELHLGIPDRRVPEESA